jgi:hypothetical protein
MDKLLATIDTTLGDLSFWIGLVVVFIFARERFGQTQLEADELELPVPVRSFTTRFRYNFAAFVYGGLYSAIYGALICLGAFPNVQDVIKQWFGTIGIEQKIQIGTPIGAAMLTISVLPSIPFVRNWDNGVRSTLREFASIPLKARYIADLIVDHVARTIGLSAAYDGDPTKAPEELVRRKLQIFDRLKEMIRKLQNGNRLRAARQYDLYFSKFRNIEESIDDSVSKIRSDIGSAPGSWTFLIDQVDSMNRRMSRYLVSALLIVETDEYSALKVVSDELKVANLPESAWRFKSSQIALGMVNVLAAALIGSVTAAMIMMVLSNDRIDPAFLPLFFEVCMVLSIVLVPMYVTPLIFAAGAEMYIIDRGTFGDDLEWDERLLSIFLTFLGCLGSALALTVVTGVLATHALGKSLDLLQVLPWALPPAAVAMSFFVTSRTRALWKRSANAGADFVIHASVATATALIAQRLSLAAGLTYQGETPFLDGLIYALTEPLPMLTVAALIGGSLGTIQCAISRQVSVRT